MNAPPKNNLLTSALPPLTFILAALVTLFSVSVLIGWMTNSLQLTRLSAEFIPMAPTTAFCFILLGAAWLCRQWSSGPKHIHRIGLALVSLALFFCLTLVLQFMLVSVTSWPLDIEQWLVSALPSEAGNVTGRMSPLTALLFILLSSAALLSPPQRDVDRMRDHLAQSVAALVLMLAGAHVVGYWYGAPLLYSGTTTPVALPTAISFMLLSSGSLFEGPRAWLTHWLTSPSVFSQFTRLVLPGIVAIILLDGWAEANIFTQAPPVYRVLSLSLRALFSAGLVALLTMIIARRVQRAVARAEQAVRESEERLTAVMEGSQLGYSDWNIPSGEIRRNERWATMLGYTLPEIGATYLQWEDLLHPDDRETARQVVQDHLAGKTPIHRDEYRLRAKDGTYRWILDQGKVIEYDAQGQPLRLTATHTDITARKQAEEALRAATAQLEALIQVSPLAIILLDAEGAVRLWNPSAERIFGWTAAEVIGQPNPIVPEAKQAEYVLWRDHILQGHSITNQESVRRRKDGSLVDVSLSSAPVYDAAHNLTGRMAIIADVTERKRAEVLRHESEEKYRQLIELTPNGILIHLGGKIVFSNVAAARLLGVGKPEDLMGQPLLGFVHPAYRDVVIERVKQIVENKSQAPLIEEKLVRLDGVVIDAEVTAVPFRYNNEEAVQVVFREITAQKRAEQVQAAIYRVSEVAQAAKNLEELFHSIHAIIGELMPARNFYIALYDTVANQVYFPYYVDEFDVTPPPRAPRRGLTGYVFSTGQPLLTTSESYYQLVHSGHVEQIGMPPVNWLGVPLKTQRGETIGVMTVQTYQGGGHLSEADQNVLVFISTQVAMVIERKRAEATLRESETLLKEAQRLAQMGHYVLDIGSGLWTSSETLDQVFGIEANYQRDVNSWLELVHPEQRTEMLNYFTQHVLTAHQFFDKEYRIVRVKDQAPRWVHGLGQLEFSPEGQLLKMFGVIQDVTERRQTEEQIKNALAEKETLLRELYHRTKNNMQVISALLDLQAASMADERLQEAFVNTQNRIRSMALVHQKLYEAQDLSRVNLKEYIGDLVDLLLTSYNVSRHRLSLVSQMENVFVLIDQAVPCGLILNELISNALKYAFPAEQKGEIEMRLVRLASGEIQLRVADNGVGVPPGFDFRSDGRLGAQTIFILGENQLKGQVVFETAKGVACQIQFKDDLYKPRV